MGRRSRCLRTQTTTRRTERQLCPSQQDGFSPVGGSSIGPVNESPTSQSLPTERLLQSVSILISRHWVLRRHLYSMSLGVSFPPDSLTSIRTCVNRAEKKQKRSKAEVELPRLVATPQWWRCRIPNRPLIRLLSFAKCSMQDSLQAYATCDPQARSLSVAKAMPFHPWPNWLRRAFASSLMMGVACRTTDLCVARSNTRLVCQSRWCWPSTAKWKR